MNLPYTFLLEEAGAHGGGKWRNNCSVWIKDNQTPCPFPCDLLASEVSWSCKHVCQYFYSPKFKEMALVFSVSAGCDVMEGYRGVSLFRKVTCNLMLIVWLAFYRLTVNMSPTEPKVGLFVYIMGWLGKTVTTGKTGVTFRIPVDLIAKGSGKKMVDVGSN